MVRPHLLFLLGCALLLASGPLVAAESDGLTARIDHHLAAGWKAAEVPPALPADDAEFVRRVTIDLAGRIPSVAEVREFLADHQPDKRRRLVEKLLDSPRYATHFTRFWRGLLLPEASNNDQFAFFAQGMDGWLHHHLAANTPYDKVVRELLTFPFGAAPGQQQQIFYGAQGQQSPINFYTAKEFKAENLAASTARLFMGIKLECAQCHNHPFASWKREQFWGLAAFFAGIDQRNPAGGFTYPSRELIDRREMTIPGTDRIVQASFLDGTEPRWKYKASARTTLADWLTAPKNPYFARATVNRMWGYFFGVGLVDPVDDMFGDEHAASHPELLDELAADFAAHHFDLKYLIRAITASRAYQLSSAKSHPEQDRPQLFARMPVRGLSGEQLFDSVIQATGYTDNGPQQPYFFGVPSQRRDFLARFGSPTDRPTEVQTSILQALSMMNGSLIDQVTHLENSVTLSAILDAPFMSTDDRIETLYLATLSRKPGPRELARCRAFLARKEAAAPADKKDRRVKEAFADLFWALLNSSEFMFNH
jgi:hypothetical protein